ncbi:hypothetical protein BH11MYX1_BH11MYX1_49780 [soil metagenome]
MHPDAFGPTEGRPAGPPPARLYRRETVAVLVLITSLVGLGLGVVIARSTAPAEPSVPRSQRGELKVTAKPSDANVVIDGRFVGVTPIDHLDLEPGKHSVVLDAFGFQPYAGTLGIEERGVLNLAVLMAPIGSETQTRGTVGGVGTAIHSVVPPSALLPASPPPGAVPVPSAPVRRPAAAVFERPRRDCDGEKSRCSESCRSADFSCTSSCQGCGSCTGNWDDCHRQCATCRAGCEQNVKFCQSSCDNQASNCGR